MGDQIKKINISDQVYSSMLENIVTGNWKEGDFIPSENILSDQYGVSRDSVRQAVHKLSALGLVKTRQGKGTYVQKLDMGFYMNLLVPSILLNEGDNVAVFEFAKSIQVESARIACRIATEEQIEKLRSYLNGMEEIKEYEEYLQCDMNYHRCLCEISGNSLFVKAIDIINVLLHEVMKNRIALHGNAVSIAQHTRCYEAILERDEEKATKTMGEHYDFLIREVRMLQGRGVEKP